MIRDLLEKELRREGIPEWQIKKHLRDAEGRYDDLRGSAKTRKPGSRPFVKDGNVWGMDGKWHRIDGPGPNGKWPNGVRADADGFPIFKSECKDVILDESLWGNRLPKTHNKAANKALYDQIQADPSLQQRLNLSDADVTDLLTSSEAPPGFTWHHHQDSGRMQLVDVTIHGDTPHTGGMSIWGGGYAR
ncbi:MAG: HNH endonuclease [Planctomycetaceae bacterium]